MHHRFWTRVGEELVLKEPIGASFVGVPVALLKPGSVTAAVCLGLGADRVPDPAIDELQAIAERGRA